MMLNRLVTNLFCAVLQPHYTTVCRALRPCRTVMFCYGQSAGSVSIPICHSQQGIETLQGKQAGCPGLKALQQEFG